MVNFKSVVSMKPADSDVVIGYQVDEFTHTLLAEDFIVQSQISPRFMGKVSSLAHFLLKLGCEDYTFFYQAVKEFEHGLNSILMDSVETQEINSFTDEPDAIISSISSGFLYLVSIFLITLNHSFT